MYNIDTESHVRVLYVTFVFSTMYWLPIPPAPFWKDSLRGEGKPGTWQRLIGWGPLVNEPFGEVDDADSLILCSHLFPIGRQSWFRASAPGLRSSKANYFSLQAPGVLTLSELSGRGK